MAFGLGLSSSTTIGQQGSVAAAYLYPGDTTPLSHKLLYFAGCLVLLDSNQATCTQF